MREDVLILTAAKGIFRFFKLAGGNGKRDPLLRIGGPRHHFWHSRVLNFSVYK